MSNIITNDYKEQLRQGYIRRAVVALVSLLLFGCSVAALVLVPVVLYATIVLRGAGVSPEYMQTSPRSSIGKQRQEILRTLRADKKLLLTIADIDAHADTQRIVQAIHTILDTHKDTTIGVLALKYREDTGDIDIRISGTTQTRATMVALRDAFEKDALFTITRFPLSNLTPWQGVYTFVIELRVSASASNQESS